MKEKSTTEVPGRPRQQPAQGRHRDAEDAVSTTNLIGRIQSELAALRPAERRVARVVLSDVEAAISASSASLAEAAAVSEPTVMRFCRSMGCEGVRDFKLRLAQSLVAGTMRRGAPGGAKDKSDLPYWNAVFGQAMNAITLAERQLDTEAALAAIGFVARAKRVFVFGLGGGSTALAMDLQFRLFRFGLAVTAYPDSYLMRMAAATATADDAVVAISATGRTPELLDAVATAANYGAVVVAVTRTGSELARSARVALTVDVPETVDLMKPTASRFAFLAIIDLLATGVAHALGSEGQETWRRVKLHLMRIREGEVLEPLGD